MVSDGDPLVDEAAAWRSDAVARPVPPVARPRAVHAGGAARLGRSRRSDRAAEGRRGSRVHRAAARGVRARRVDRSGADRPAVHGHPERPAALSRRCCARGTAALHRRQPPTSRRCERLVQELRVYLGEQGSTGSPPLRITPIVRWELTLLLGKAALGRLPALGEERSLNASLARNYRRLVRLPWLQRESDARLAAARLLAELPPSRQDELRTVVERPAGEALAARRSTRSSWDSSARRAATSDPRSRSAARRDGADGDLLYLGYMSGVSPEQLALRAPARWASWARRLRLPREPGWRGWLARAGQRARAEWARWAWADGLPYLGLNRWRALALVLLLLPLVVALGGGGPVDAGGPGDPRERILRRPGPSVPHRGAGNPRGGVEPRWPPCRLGGRVRHAPDLGRGDRDADRRAAPGSWDHGVERGVESRRPPHRLRGTRRGPALGRRGWRAGPCARRQRGLSAARGVEHGWAAHPRGRSSRAAGLGRPDRRSRRGKPVPGSRFAWPGIPRMEPRPTAARLGRRRRKDRDS